MERSSPAPPPRRRPTRGQRWQLGLAVLIAASFPLIVPIVLTAPPTLATAVFASLWLLALHGPPFALLLLVVEPMIDSGWLLLGLFIALLVLLPFLALSPLRFAIDRAERRGRWLRAQLLVAAVYLASVPVLTSIGLGL